jgi:hypothetical protein
MTRILGPDQETELQHASQRTTKGTLAVSQYVQTWSANTHLGLQTLITRTAIVGAGAIVNPTQAIPWVGLSVGTASGDEAVYHSRTYMRYWAYRTHRLSFACSFATAVENTVQRIGLFDDNDGFFFQFDTDGLHVVHRTSTSGSPVDTVVSQADFNQDKLNGSYPSHLRAGLDFRFDRGITFGIEYNWYGTQCGKFFMAYGSSVVYLHDFVFTGQVDGKPYMRTAMLPFKAQIINTGTAPSSSTMRVGTCSHSVADDTSIDTFYQFSVSNGTTGIAVDSTTNWTDLLAIRPKTTFNSIQNRGLMEITHWQLLAEGNSIEYRIIDNVTYTGGTWTSVGTTSIAEFSVSPGTQAGTPRAIDINYLYSGRTAGNDTPENLADNNIRIGLDTSTGAQPCYVVQARKLSASTATVYAAMTWKEQY